MFFDAQPNFLYPDFKDSSQLKVSKNIFRRVRARDSFNAIFSSSLPYVINPGETVEQVSFRQLDDPRWYWTILLLNNITDIATQWPLSADELEEHIDIKYGEKVDNIRHWETDKIEDDELGVVLEQGTIIEFYQGSAAQNQPGYLPNWQFKYYKRSPSVNGVVTQIEVTVPAATGLTPVTNREWEYEQNELKRDIIIPRKRYLSTMKQEIEDLYAYDTKYKITNEGLRLSEPYVR